MDSIELDEKVFHILVMVRLAAAVAWTRMAGRAALVAMDEARREAATRTAAIVMVVDGLRGEVWMERCNGFEVDGWEKSGRAVCDLGKRALESTEGRARKNEGTGGQEKTGRPGARSNRYQLGRRNIIGRSGAETRDSDGIHHCVG